MKRTNDSSLLPYLPAAVEVIHTPPPAGCRLLIWTIACAFATAVAWACLAEVDTVVVAEGKLVPDGQIKRIQPLRTGVIANIHVQDGQHVRRGERLITLETRELDTDIARVTTAIRHASAEYARVSTLLTGLVQGELPAEATLVRHERQTSALHARATGDWSAYRAVLDSLSANAALAYADRVAADRLLAKAAAVLPLAREREASLATLLTKSAIPRPQWLAARENLLVQEHDLSLAAAAVERAEADRQARQLALAEHAARWRATWLRQLDEARAELDNLQHEQQRLSVLRQQSELRAPVSGIVDSLAAHTVGGVVTTASEVVGIVPDSVKLIAEVHVRDRDIGFIDGRSPVVVKLNSFPYTRHGTVSASITHIATASRRLPADKAQGEAAFLLRLRLERQAMLVAQRHVPLVAGMQLTADIRTGKRRVAEYLLEPVLRAMREALRER